jgi:hypothetical protein
MKSITKLNFIILSIATIFLFSCQKNEVTDISLNKSAITLNVGQSESIIVSISISGEISKQPVTWTAADPKVLSLEEGDSKTDGSSVSKTIVVTALAAGTTDITIQAGAKSIICQVTVNQTSYNFKKVSAANWGDYYDIGTNNFTINLFENGLNIDTAGVSGTGTLLHLELNVPISQNSIEEGSFNSSDNGEINTFFPGGYVASQGDTIPVGSFTETFTQTEIITTLITGGNYKITASGSNFIIEGNLITSTDEVIHFYYTGVISLTDRKNAVQIYPTLTKGELVYYGDIYQSKLSNNFTLYLYSETVNATDTILNGDLLQLEVNTALNVTDSLPTGTYNTMPEIKFANLLPYTLVPGYTNSTGNNWGIWFYRGSATESAAKKIKDGSLTISRQNNQYIINYELYDRFGSKVSGNFTGPLTYINGTTSASTVSASRIKRASAAKRNITDIQHVKSKNTLDIQKSINRKNNRLVFK